MKAVTTTSWYRRTVQVDGSRLDKDNYIIHFEGSDFVTKLWVNGQFAGSHRGGYAAFTFDITDLVHDGENELVVKVEDSFDMQQPRGKQRWIDKNFGCWYVQTTVSGKPFGPSMCRRSAWIP